MTGWEEVWILRVRREKEAQAAMSKHFRHLYFFPILSFFISLKFLVTLTSNIITILSAYTEGTSLKHTKRSVKFWVLLGKSVLSQLFKKTYIGLEKNFKLD